LRCYFERYGTVRDVKIIRDETSIENARVKYSYGFITFSTEEEAKKVVELNKVEMGRAFKFQGRYLNVNEAIKKPPNKLRLDSMPMATGMICRDQNGQLLTLYPSYTVVSNPDPYGVMQQPCMSIPPPMMPIIVQSQPMYQLAAPLPQAPNVPQMAYAQAASSQPPAANGSAPTPGYYQ